MTTTNRVTIAIFTILNLFQSLNNCNLKIAAGFELRAAAVNLSEQKDQRDESGRPTGAFGSIASVK
jgi:hypothetical protein